MPGVPKSGFMLYGKNEAAIQFNEIVYQKKMAKANLARQKIENAKKDIIVHKYETSPAKKKTQSLVEAV